MPTKNLRTILAEEGLLTREAGILSDAGHAPNKHARQYDFEKFKAEFYGARSVPARVAREFWDDFQNAFDGTLDEYKRQSKRAADKVARYNWRDVEGMDPEKAMAAADRIRLEAGRKAKSFLQHHRADAYEAEQKAARLEKAWGKWDWDTLLEMDVITTAEYDFVFEVEASYTP